MEVSKLKEIEVPMGVARASGAQTQLAAIFKVRKKLYHPPGVAVRAQIDDTLFTAEFDAGILPQLISDPLIDSVSLGKPLGVWAKP